MHRLKDMGAPLTCNNRVELLMSGDENSPTCSKRSVAHATMSIWNTSTSVTTPSPELCSDYWPKR